MRTIVITVVAAVLMWSAPAEAQKNCRKGIPCGNSCIAANKTCRVGTSRPTPVRTTPPRAVVQQGSADTATSGAWVASTRGTTYYRAGCSGANKLSPSNRIYFKSEAAAEAAGYTRSRAKGC